MSVRELIPVVFDDVDSCVKFSEFDVTVNAVARSFFLELSLICAGVVDNQLQSVNEFHGCVGTWLERCYPLDQIVAQSGASGDDPVVNF